MTRARGAYRPTTLAGTESRTGAQRRPGGTAESDAPDGRPRVAYVIGTYPLLTTTFIDREIRELRSQGMHVEVISLRRPRPDLSPDQVDLVESTTYARPAPPAQVLRHHAQFLIRCPGRFATTFARLVTARGQSIRQRFRTAGHFALGVHVAGLLLEAPPVQQIHAHFIDRAATVAHVASRLVGVPYSVTAHANDIYVSPVLLEMKMRGAAFVATCTAYNRTHLAHVAPDAADRIIVNYHGLDLHRYSPDRPAESTIPRLVAVGQLAERKGFFYLLDACRSLTDGGLSIRCEIIGEGPLRPALERRIHELGLDDAVTLRGALPHAEVIEAYRGASVFVLPCILGDDGSRDGIPNVILEAMAMGLPVVSTRLSGVPEAVEHGVTGLLVPPRDGPALTAALESVLAVPSAARAMGNRGRVVVEDRFDVRKNVRALCDGFAPAGATP